MDKEIYFYKSINFFTASLALLFLNRSASYFLSPMFSSVFTSFGGYLINYSAMFFFLIGAGIYNFKKSLDDERINTSSDVLVYFVWISGLLLILFPASSIRYAIVNFPFAELICLFILSFLSSHFKSSRVFSFFKSLTFLMLIFFILPYNLLVYINYPFSVLIYMLVGKKIVYLLIGLGGSALLISGLLGILKRSLVLAFKVFSYQIAGILSFFIYIILFPPIFHHKVQRIGYILFYTAIIPCFYIFYRKRDIIYSSIKNYFTKGSSIEKQESVS